jgi:hypothetical protein
VFGKVSYVRSLCIIFERWKRRISLLIKVKNSKINKMFGEIMKLRLLKPKKNSGKNDKGVWNMGIVIC